MIGFVFLFCLLFRWIILHRVILVVGWCQVYIQAILFVWVLTIWHSLGLVRAHLCMKCCLSISNFLEEISSLSHPVVFLYLFALIAEEGFLVSSCYSLELCIQMFISFLFLFAFCFSSFHSICKASPDSSFAFLHFFSMGMSWSLSPVQCHEPPSIVLQALC